MKNAVMVCALLLGSVAMAQSSVASSHSVNTILPSILLAQAGHQRAISESSMSSANLPASRVLTVTGCWIRSLPVPAPSAGYFVVKNTGEKAVKLIGASSTAYGMVMLHQTTHADGLSKMSIVDDIPIAAGTQLEFKPGGYHAMLEKPTQEIKVGSSVSMDFQFDSGEKVTASCDVKPATTLAH